MDGVGARQAVKSEKSSLVRIGEKTQARVRFSIDTERRLVIVWFGEHVTAADIQDYVQELCSHPSFNRSFAEIADISQVKELPLQTSDFLELADRTDPFSLESKRAFVARTSLQKHAAQVHKILRSQRNFQIFQTMDEAESWIASY